MIAWLCSVMQSSSDSDLGGKSINDVLAPISSNKKVDVKCEKPVLPVDGGGSVASILLQ